MNAMGKYMYEFIPIEGKHIFIRSKTRSRAIDEYCSITGCPKRFIKEHIRVVNAGRESNDWKMFDGAYYCADGERRADNGKIH